MNSALIRFVADYHAGHAARADVGAGALGRVHIDPHLVLCTAMPRKVTIEEQQLDNWSQKTES